ncbi:unnamed protein product [Cochlearia groenlandica]
MGDSQDAKIKGTYTHWTEPEHKMLLRLLVEAINLGFRDANNKFNKLTVESRVLSTLNQMLGAKKTYAQFRNRMRVLKTKYQSLADLLRFNSGFGWDSETKKFTARDEVWNEYLKELRMIFSSNIASGHNVVGLGDPVDAYAYQAGDNDETNVPNRVQMVDDVEGITYENISVEEVFSSLEKSSLKERKQEWEKEAEEKEAEDKANNVWDAIKEIPDLDDDLRYEAMTLVHSLTMKFGFVQMSIEDRRGWIKRNLHKLP